MEGTAKKKKVTDTIFIEHFSGTIVTGINIHLARVEAVGSFLRLRPKGDREKGQRKRNGAGNGVEGWG